MRGNLMKTFEQFLDEKYYPPNRKLPGSGKTPVAKAKAKGISGDLLKKNI